MIQIKVNGVEHTFDGDPEMPLLWYLRDELGLTGTKFGCGIALCGACTVHKNGEAIRSCVVAMRDIGRHGNYHHRRPGDNGLHPVQQAWMRVNVPQCGYCQPGQIMQAAAFLNNQKSPTDQEIDEAMARQHLPLRNLPAHSCGDQDGGGGKRMNAIENVSRRSFLKGMVSTGALVLGACYYPELLWADGLPKDTLADRATLHPNMFVGIDTDGTVYIVAHRSEMGTGIRTSLPMVVADELDADWKRVKIEQAIGDPRYGDQNTDGSHSIRSFYDVMREAGATARLMLDTGGRAAMECRAGRVHDGTRTSSSIGRPAGAWLMAIWPRSAAKLPVPKKEELQFKSKSSWRYIGKGMPELRSGGLVQRESDLRHGCAASTAWFTPRSSIRRFSAAK